ncbi:MAG TPA: MFS transporter, partial [Bryobacteraceae bacterium]|nr:MFS transporter [Bryobacteraceae bacterium]
MPAFSMLLVSLLSYVDRNALAILAPTILSETHISAEQYGIIIACFSYAYMLGNPVWGWLLDRMGVRRGMNLAVGLWTVASAAHAWATGFWSFSIARFALGAGEGATFPGGLRTVAQTLPPSKRGKGLAVAYSGGSLGAMIAPLIVTPIALWWGWHGVFLATGAFGATWLLLWRRIGAGVDRGVEFSKERLPWASPQLWAYIALYGVGALPLAFILYDSPLYLHARFGWSQAILGKVLWIPPSAWEVGYFAWGAILDRTGPRYRGLTMAAVATGLPLFFAHSLPSGAAVLIAMWLEMFSCAGLVVLAVAYVTGVFASSQAGLLAGLGAGSWGAVVALMMPLFGRMFDRAEYALSFQIAAVFPLAGYL